jgi:hypothetical protein
MKANYGANLFPKRSELGILIITISAMGEFVKSLLLTLHPTSFWAQ